MVDELEEINGSECVFLGVPTGGRSFSCRRIGETTMDTCRSCDQFKQLQDALDWRWGVSVTTTRRMGADYLTGTLSSLKAAGWQGYMVSTDHGRLGAFGNFYLSLTRSAMSFPNARGYLYCQDDVRLTVNVRRIVQDAVDSGKSVVSLYTPDHLDLVPQGWVQVDHGWETGGACCFAFSARAMRDLLTDDIVFRHRWRGPLGGRRQIDQVVGAWASRFGGIWYHSPGFARHVGMVSSIEK